MKTWPVLAGFQLEFSASPFKAYPTRLAAAAAATEEDLSGFGDPLLAKTSAIVILLSYP